MSTPASPHSSSSGSAHNPAPADAALAAPGFEERLGLFWQQYRRWILGACVVILLAILGWGGRDLLAAQKERSVAAAYAQADSSDRLRAFAAEHSGHALAGVAHLRLADEAYTAGRYDQAKSEYQQAALALKEGALRGRAALGAAVATVQAGQAAEGEAALRLVANDVNHLRSVRAEASYHLAALAAAAGRTDEARQSIEQIASIDPMGIWSQRAMMLQTTLPAPAPVPAPASVPAPAAEPGAAAPTAPPEEPMVRFPSSQP